MLKNKDQMCKVCTKLIKLECKNKEIVYLKLYIKINMRKNTKELIGNYEDNLEILINWWLIYQKEMIGKQNIKIIWLLEWCTNKKQ